MGSFHMAEWLGLRTSDHEVLEFKSWWRRNWAEDYNASLQSLFIPPSSSQYHYYDLNNVERYVILLKETMFFEEIRKILFGYPLLSASMLKIVFTFSILTAIHILKILPYQKNFISTTQGNHPQKQHPSNGKQGRWVENIFFFFFFFFFLILRAIPGQVIPKT